MKYLLTSLLFFVLISGTALAQTDSGGGGGGSASGGSSLGVGAMGQVAPPSNYQLKPMDILRVDVYQEEDLQREVRIEGDGTVSLPLIGRVNVGGMRVADVQSMIAELYDRDFIVNPQVSVIVLSYAERRIQVLGQVNAPGFVIIPPEEKMTVLQAISGARGFTALANERRVQIRRSRADGSNHVFEIDVRQILRDPDSHDAEVQDGDILYVFERIF